jgi:phosphoribosylanthranilate isomerase
MKIKLCGFTEEESIKTAVAQKCDFLGFVFCQKSVRNITPKNAAKISAQVPKDIAKVAVVVDAEFSFLDQIATEFAPDFFQFHGQESVQFLEQVRQKFPQIKIIKALKISEKKDLESVKDFENHVDLFLFDSKVSGEIGGSGKKFDWKILQNFNSKKDWFLSGGINVDNIVEALEITGAKMIDISSGIEEIRGKKSSKLIEEFIIKLRSNLKLV